MNKKFLIFLDAQSKKDCVCCFLIPLISKGYLLFILCSTYFFKESYNKMGCCFAHTQPPPAPEPKKMQKVGSYTDTNKSSRRPSSIKKFAVKTEPQPSYETNETNDNSPQHSKMDEANTTMDKPEDQMAETDESYTPDNPPLDATKSDFQIKMEERKSELLREKQKLQQCMLMIYPCTVHIIYNFYFVHSTKGCV